MDKYTLLHSGFTLPGDGEPLLRNEGIYRHCTIYISMLLLHGRMLVKLGRLSVLG